MLAVLYVLYRYDVDTASSRLDQQVSIQLQLFPLLLPTCTQSHNSWILHISLVVFSFLITLIYLSDCCCCSPRFKRYFQLKDRSANHEITIFTRYRSFTKTYSINISPIIIINTLFIVT